MYIDANIFIYASIDNKKLGDNCRKIIKAINQNQVSCASSYLVIDEVLYILKKHIGKNDALTLIKSILSLPIKWIEVDKKIMISMISLFDTTSLDPRDAIHVASMKTLGLFTIVSEDADFDTIDEVDRLTAEQVINKRL